MRNLFLLLTFSIFFNGFYSTAQSLSVRGITNKEGLLSNKILCIQQDFIGRIWMGTPQGTCCYDGSEFTLYSKSQNGQNHISNNIVQAILPLANGDVWLGTPDSLNIYNWKTDKITTLGTQNGLLSKDITALAKGKSCVWIGTFGEGLFKYDQAKNKFSTIKIISQQKGTAKIMALCEDSNHQLWIGTRYNGLFLYTPHKNECRQILGIPPYDFVNTIFQDLSGNIWVGTSDNLYHIENNIAKVVNSNLFQGKCIYAISENPAGTIWVGSENVLITFNPDALFNYSIPNDNSLFSNYELSYKGIHSLFSDKDNNLWVGTYGDGIKIINNNSYFTHVNTDFKNHFMSANQGATYAICPTFDNNFWIGREKEGIVKYDFRNQQVIERIELNGTNVFSILEDNERNLWIGTNGQGLAVRRKGTNNISHIDNTIGPAIRKIYQAKDSSIYVSADNGFFKSSNGVKSWNNILQKWYNKNPDIRCVAEDRQNRLWLGTYNSGLLCYNPTNNSLQRFLKPNGLKSNIIFDILLDNDILWIATDEGIVSYDISKNSFSRQIPCNQIPDITIYSIQKDSLNNLWFSSSMGLWQYETKREKTNHYSASSLPKIGEFTEGVSAKGVDGQLYFGSFNGLLQVNSHQNNTITQKSSLIFTKLIIDDQLITPGNENLPENINISKKINVYPDNQSLSIHFAVPYYDKEVQYYYKLDRIDEDWKPLGNQNWVTFRDLASGDYNLIIRAEVCDEHTDMQANIHIIVMPPFWATWWAIAFYFLVICVIIYYTYRSVKSRIILAHRIELEKNDRKKEEEIHEAKLMFFTNLSHELRTPLTLLLTPLEDLIDHESNENKKNTLKLINKSANRLLLLVNQILDFRKSEKGEMKLCVKEVNLNLYFDDLSSYFSELAKQQELDYHFDNRLISNMGWIDPALIEKICFNLLSNAFKFSHKKGCVEFTISSDEHWLTLKVSDNGIGIKDESLQSIFKPFFQENRDTDNYNPQTNRGSGIGLYIVKSITELHHGHITLNSIPNEETVFTVRIPFVEEAYDDKEIYTRNEDMPNDVITSNTSTNIQIDASANESKPRVLLVEDNEELYSYLQPILSRKYEISIANNGSEAISKIESSEFDLIVSDIMMPVMDGIELCKYLKKNIETNYIPIILLTAKSSVDEMIAGIEIGADAYITKPFNLAFLCASIDRIIDSRRILRSKFSQISELNLELKEEGGVENKFMYEVTEFIKEHISDENLNGNMIAADLCMSRTSLHRKLKSIAGISAGELIKNIRISKASRDLVTSEDTISEIAFNNGFSSPSYFSQCFTGSYGMSPKEFRINNKTN